jgi:TldD protein
MIDDAALFHTLLSTALERGGDYADIYAQTIRNRAVVFEEGKVKNAVDSLRQGVGIRVQQQEATGYAVCEDPDPTMLIAAARRAAAIASAGSTATIPPDLSRRPVPNRYPQIRPVSQVALADRVAYARRASEKAYALDARVQWVSVFVQDQLDDVTIATSDGIHVRDVRPRVKMFMSATGAVRGRHETVWEMFGKRCGFEVLDLYSAETLAIETLRRLDVRLRAIESPAGEMPVVLAAGEGGIMIHEAVGHGLEADFNRKGVSAYSGRIGDLVANPMVTVFDRSDRLGDSGSLNVDDEGIIPGETTLIERGRLRTYLTDRLSARILHVDPSGNGRRQDYSHVPQPRMRITGLGPGQESRDEIIARVPRGLYVASIGGGSVDITKGDFNFQVEEAYLIENGKLGAPVRGACLIGNGPDVMQRITGLGNDLRFMDCAGYCGKGGQNVPVGYGCPTTLISSMVVGGSAS